VYAVGFCWVASQQKLSSLIEVVQAEALLTVSERIALGLKRDATTGEWCADIDADLTLDKYVLEHELMHS
jgi:hypothetical protein